MTRSTPPPAGRDPRIDWLRGIAMTCVIIDHSRRSSLLSWFSYERFWVVTAAEVFVVLSGVVLGMVYGRRLARDGWTAVARGLGRRALILYGAYVGVTLSVLLIALAGVDVTSVGAIDRAATAWFVDPRQMDLAAWRHVALMHYGPWAFEIVGLYVWLVLAAIPCFLLLRLGGWRLLLSVSWGLYGWYQLAPHHLTSSEFETVFPILTWQLLFVHGIAIGYYREQLRSVLQMWPRLFPITSAVVTGVFATFALCNPWMEGPGWLHWAVVSPERFSDLYGRFFALSELGIGRILNVAFALPSGYAVLAWFGPIARPLQAVFATLGRRSLGAFVLHVYGLLLLAQFPDAGDLWTNTIVQVLFVLAIAGALGASGRFRRRPHRGVPLQTQPLAA